jgi:hypothetical protein|tara:strand:+ start:254 stop:589 length:336 start_codon:yes stop_codon:yes gene_type:complete
MKNYDPSSFYIQLKPVQDEENSWTGGLEVSIIRDELNPMDAESIHSLGQLSNLVACCVAYMDENQDFIDEMYRFMQEEDEENFVDMSPNVEYKNGSNIIQIHFNSKTKGSA